MSQELQSSRKTAVPPIGDCLKEGWHVGKPMACTSKEGGGDLEVAMRSREDMDPICHLQACRIHRCEEKDSYCLRTAIPCLSPCFLLPLPHH